MSLERHVYRGMLLQHERMGHWNIFRLDDAGNVDGFVSGAKTRADAERRVDSLVRQASAVVTPLGQGPDGKWRYRVEYPEATA